MTPAGAQGGAFSISMALVALCAWLLWTMDDAPYFRTDRLAPVFDCEIVGSGEGLRPSAEGRVLYARPVIDDFEAGWFGSILREAGEPSLLRTRPEDDAWIVRLSWLRSFHDPMIVRVERRRGGLHLSAIRLHAIGSEPGSTLVERALTPAETDRLLRALSAADLATQSGGQCEVGLDGAHWIFEQRTATEHLAVDHWTLGPGATRDLGLTLLALTGWPLEPIY
jgi:hypothetical protein